MHVRHNFEDVLHSTVAYTSISHFLVLFGYKLFSLYYPLFLESKGFDLTTVGSMYLLIYLTIAITSPIIKKLIEGKRASIMMAFGILGYAIYSLGMIFSETRTQFYFWQIYLGVSSATFYISARSIIMEARSRSYDRDFAYFYSAPLYSTFLAPLMGGLVMWKYGFERVFLLSIVVYLIAMVFSIKEGKNIRIKKGLSGEISYVRDRLKDRKTKLMIFLAFTALFSIGIYRSFFVLFLKKEFGLSRIFIVIWIVMASFVSIPISWKIAKFVERRKSEDNILTGNPISGFIAVMIALSYNTYILFVLYVSEYTAKIISESGKSGFITQLFKSREDVGAMLDTMLTSAGVAIGALVGGMVAQIWGLREMFMLNGVLLLSTASFGKRILSKNHHRTSNF